MLERGRRDKLSFCAAERLGALLACGDALRVKSARSDRRWNTAVSELIDKSKSLACKVSPFVHSARV
jgi:hypothetical protein